MPLILVKKIEQPKLVVGVPLNKSVPGTNEHNKYVTESN